MLATVTAFAAPRFRRLLLGAALLALAGVGTLFLATRSEPPRVSNSPLRHDVYVWQRRHTEALAEAVQARAARFGATVVLAAEVSWKKAPHLPPPPGAKPEHTTPQPPIPVVTRVAIDWESLQTVSKVGLALRINAYPGPFTADDPTTRLLTALAYDLVREARDHGVAPVEFQIDFDAATEKLDGYREWLRVLRPAVAPVPLVFTALPTWLGSSKFAKLARAADSYVLQVHSLQRPARPDSPILLCNPVAARAAIERAGRIGRPFRVALPTYGYTYAFDAKGNFAGLSAEGTAPAWQGQPGYVVRELSAEPVSLAGLVASLRADRPAAMTGLIWYRLPVAGDRLNWSWPMLTAVMQGNAPEARLVATPRRNDRGLIEFTLTNAGDGDFSGPVKLTARWQTARRIAADGIGGFTIAGDGAQAMRLTSPALRLPAGETQVIGWLRLSTSSSAPNVAIDL